MRIEIRQAIKKKTRRWNLTNVFFIIIILNIGPKKTNLGIYPTKDMFEGAQKTQSEGTHIWLQISLNHDKKY